jgi:hypothetical protein
MNDRYHALLGSIGENNRRINKLLREKRVKMNQVQSIVERKAKTKTPLNERQVQNFHEFAGLYTQEGGILQQSLMGINHTLAQGIQKHTGADNTEIVLITLHKHQKKAIASLRRIIASSENTLQLLQGAVA